MYERRPSGLHALKLEPRRGFRHLRPPAEAREITREWGQYHITLAMESEIRNTNLLSAVCATLLCHLLWRLSRRWMLRSLSPANGTGSAVVPVPPLLELGPLCGAMLAGLGFPVWGFATFAEVYHVTSSGLVAAILVTCHWRDNNPGGMADDSLIAAGGFGNL